MRKILLIIAIIFPTLESLATQNLSDSVLSYFKNDKLKYQAALFLLQNMDAHYSYASKGISSYYHYMDSIFTLPLHQDDFYIVAYE